MVKELTQKEKVMMAIWMFNRLIDRFPDIYIRLKGEYLEQEDDQLPR